MKRSVGYYYNSGGYPPGEQYDNAAGAIGPSIILAFTGINTLDANLKPVTR